MTSLHVWLELIITFLHIFIVLLSSLSLLAIQPIRYTPVVFFLHWPILGLIFPLHHSYVSHYQFILLHRLIINIICTLGTLKSMAHEIFYTCYILYMKAWASVIGYLSLVFLHFYHPITLAYVTSRVLRPPWDHGIRCRLRQPLLGQVFEIWLIFRYRHASFSRSRLFDV